MLRTPDFGEEVARSVDHIGMLLEIARAVDHPEHLDHPLDLVTAAERREERGEHREAYLSGRPLACVGVEVAAHAAPHKRVVGQEWAVARHIEMLAHDERGLVDADRFGRGGQRKLQGFKMLLRRTLSHGSILLGKAVTSIVFGTASVCLLAHNRNTQNQNVQCGTPGTRVVGEVGV